MRHTGQDLAVPASGHHGLTVVTTTARGGSHGQPVVAATAVVAVPLPVRFGFSAAFRIPRHYASVAASFWL